MLRAAATFGTVYDLEGTAWGVVGHGEHAQRLTFREACERFVGSILPTGDPLLRTLAATERRR